MFKSLSTRVLIALVLGLAAGAWAHSTGDATIEGGARVVEAFGGLWLNALRMTVIPLVFSLLVVGIADVADAMATGRLAARAVMLFAVLILFAAIYGIAMTLGALELFPVDPTAAAALIGGAQGSGPTLAPTEAPSFSSWLLSLVPSNPVKSAAEDAVLPLVTFAVFFGFAATRLPSTLKDPLVLFFKAVGETVIVIVDWVLKAGPIGVFALSLGVGLNAGLNAAGALLHYVLVVSIITAISTPIAFLFGVIGGKLSPAKFAAAATPVWAIAFSTQSSIASLPAMLEASRRSLGIPDRVVDLVLPLAVAVFRFTSPIANLAVCFFIAHLYGIHPTLLQMATGVFVAFAVSVGSVGLPGQVSFVASVAPICLALGLPIELLGIFLAVEVVPDIFRTLGNVTGDLAATVILNRGERATAPTPSAEAQNA